MEPKWKQLKEKCGSPLIVTGTTLVLLIFSAIRGGNVTPSELFGLEALQEENQSSPDISTFSDNLSEVAYEATIGAVFLSVGRNLLGFPLNGNWENSHVIQLPQEPTFLVPTPGGVSLFVGFSDISEIYVYSAEDFSLQARIPTNIPSPEAMTFSPTGEQAFVFWDQGRKVTEFIHSRLTLTQVETKDLELGEPRIIANRRGTRYYRTEPQGLRIHLAQQLLDADFWESQVSLPVFDPGYTEIWGISEDGTVRVIDERTGKYTRRFQQPVALQPGIVTDRISHLSADGTQLLQYTPRNSADPRIISLPESAAFLTRGSGQSLVAVSSQGTIYLVSQQGKVEKMLFDLPLAEGLFDPSGIDLVATAIVRQDGTFACF